MKNILAWLCSNLPVVLAAFFLAGLGLLFSGCYTLTQGTTMLGYLGRAVPLETLAAGEEAAEEDQLFVRRVESIRRFAMEELGLSQSKNYTRYVALDRDYLAAVVSASADDSFTRHYWWFPVVGRLPYKGFFDVEGARKERARLEKKRLDVWIRGVDAFSTLGWFKDPLYSFMRNYSDRELADLIIHELFHATVFIRNQAQFNEQLAEFVGREGARLYMEAMGIAEDDSAAAAARADRDTYRAFLHSLIAELEDLYQSGIPREETLARKAEIIEAAQTRFEENYDTLFLTDNFRFFGGREFPVNNAYLDLFRLYYEEDNFLNDLFKRSGSDIVQFIAAAKTLNTRLKRGLDPRAELERALGF